MKNITETQSRLDSKQAQVLSQFSASIKPPKQGRDAVSSFCQLARAYAKSLLGAACWSAKLAISNNAVSLEELVRRADGMYRSRLNKLYNSIVVLARREGVINEFLGHLNLAMAALRALGGAYLMPTLAIARNISQGHSNPISAAGAQLETALIRLEGFKPLLPLGVHLPLQGVQHRIWKMLEGRFLLAKEIAAELGNNCAEDSVRHHIKRIRATGREIVNMPGGGYFRPDGPRPSEV